MPDYERGEARAWAREHLVGCSSVTIPTFTADLKRLNEAAVAHDVALGVDHGFTYSLLVTETSITAEENARMTAIAREAAGGRMRFFFHAAFGTLEDNVEAVRLAEREGADLALLSYPPQFWPTTEQEVLDYTKALLRGDVARRDAVRAARLGLRAHPSRGHERRLRAPRPRRRSPTSSPSSPSRASRASPGVCEMYRHFRDEVVISCPIESDALPLMGVMDMQFSGTSNTEWMSGYYPEVFELARSGRWEEAMERYWRGAAGAAGQRRGDRLLHHGHERPQPDDVEVPGLAGRLQRRAAARAGHAHPGSPHEVPARGPRRRRGCP